MAISFWRMTCTDARYSPFTVPGVNRSYSCAAGSAIDAPDFDAVVLASVPGWLALSKQGGPTANRPPFAVRGTTWFDSTLGAFIVANGSNGWLNTITGASV